VKPYILLLLAALGCSAQPRVEVGDINGAAFRIDVPENWNGVLLVYCHGYSSRPGTFSVEKPNAASRLNAAGFAVAQSGYAAGGWAVQEAMQDTEALRRYFIRKYGKPKETYITGHSMGGFLTMALLESVPSGYDGGLALCGPLAPASTFILRNVFDLRVVFDYYFPGALPSPAKVPSEFAMSPAKNAEIEQLLDGKPEAAAALRRVASIKTNKELASALVFFTYILKDLQERGGGNPFDNRDTIYDRTGDDNAVNDGVMRYTADVKAAEYVKEYFTPTGRLARPMIHLHTTYDPLVPASIPNIYANMARQAGAGHLFVQQYAKVDGHCTMSPVDILNGLSDLRTWVIKGQRPLPGLRK
jgi:pimeloyl-ACP methyl ester carboxylesterase